MAFRISYSKLEFQIFTHPSLQCANDFANRENISKPADPAKSETNYPGKFPQSIYVIVIQCYFEFSLLIFN